MATKICSSVPASRYDIYPNDFLDQSYQVPINNSFDLDSPESFLPTNEVFDMGSGGSFLPSYINGVQAPSFLFPLPLPLPFQQPNNISYFQPPQVGQAPTFPTSGVTYSGELAPAFQPYNGAPHFQTPPSLTSSPSSSSGSSTSLQCTLTPSPAPSRKKAQKVNPKTKSKGKQAIQNVLHAARHKLLTVKPTRKRAPNNRPPGTAFSDLLDDLPDEVRTALDMDYTGCCEAINTADTSTIQKHRFSNRHCLNIPKEYQEFVPSFICPAYLAFHSECRTAKAGRYDSTYRHCQNCFGFKQMKSDSNKDVFPVVISRGEFKAFQIYRMADADPKKKEDVTSQVEDTVRKVLERVFIDNNELPVVNHEGESNACGTVMPVSVTGQQLTTPMLAPTSHLEQPLFFWQGGADDMMPYVSDFP